MNELSRQEVFEKDYPDENLTIHQMTFIDQQTLKGLMKHRSIYELLVDIQNS